MEEIKESMFKRLWKRKLVKFFVAIIILAFFFFGGTYASFLMYGGNTTPTPSTAPTACNNPLSPNNKSDCWANESHDETVQIGNTGNIYAVGNLTMNYSQGGYGYFSWLGSNLARITKIWATNADINYINSTTTNASSNVFINNVGVAQYLYNQTSAGYAGWNQSGTNVFTGSSTYKVGIGTTLPTQALSIEGGNLLVNGSTSYIKTEAFAGLIMINSTSSSSGDSILSLRNGVASRGSDYMYDTSDSDLYIKNLYDNNNGDIIFQTKSSGTPVNAMTITGAGNVGIGTTTPNYALEVNSNIKGLNVSNFLFANASNVGIGTTSPKSALQIASSGTDVDASVIIGNSDATHHLIFYGGRQNNALPYIAWNSADSLRFATETSTTSAGFSEKMRISSTGLVGIGTTSPTYALDVASNGNIRVNGSTSSPGDITLHRDLSTAGSGLVGRLSSSSLNTSGTATANGRIDFYNVGSEFYSRIDFLTLNASKSDLATFLSIGRQGDPFGTTQNQWVSVRSGLGVAGNLITRGSGFFGLTAPSSSQALVVVGAVNFTNSSGTGLGFFQNTKGYVGIGTSSPSSILDVIGNTSIRGNLTINGTLNVLGAVSFSSSATVDTSVLYVDNLNNKVGIQTRTPVSELDINGSLAFNGGATRNIFMSTLAGANSNHLNISSAIGSNNGAGNGFNAGNLILSTGVGGSATSGDDNGGNGGNIYIHTADGGNGNGAGSTGAEGQIYLGIKPDGSAKGVVNIGSQSQAYTTSSININGQTNIYGNLVANGTTKLGGMGQTVDFYRFDTTSQGATMRLYDYGNNGYVQLDNINLNGIRFFPVLNNGTFTVGLGSILGIQYYMDVNLGQGGIFLNDSMNRVGINTTSPLNTLYVNGNLNVTNGYYGINGTKSCSWVTTGAPNIACPDWQVVNAVNSSVVSGVTSLRCCSIG